MNHPDDTIAAIATPVGQGGIGIVRISGPRSLPIAKEIFRPHRKNALRPRCLTYGHVVDPSDGTVIDEALLAVMPAPNSYTREDVVEINCHGGMIAVRKTLELTLARGARLADPGEFTKRAFLNGRISLPQAEAVMDVISSVTQESMRIAVDQLRGTLSQKLSALRNDLLEVAAFTEACIDFPEDDIGGETSSEIDLKLTGAKSALEGLSNTFGEARLFRDGLSVAIVGRPNVGKSSLLNALLKKDKAIVTDIPGTTRDVIEDFLNIDGLPVRILDTAGIRKTDETVEKEGVRRSVEAMKGADFVIAVLDGSEAMTDDDSGLLDEIRGKNALVVLNKSDLPVKLSPEDLAGFGKRVLLISAATGEGLEELKSVVFQANLKNWREDREGVVVTNLRHKIALDKACDSLAKATALLGTNQPLELFSIEMRDALDSLGEITGVVTTEDILNKIFSDFCIGK